MVLDTLRLDVFREEFEWLPGYRFEQAWSPSNWTVPVHGSLFTGRSPGRIGVHAKDQTLDCAESTLAEILRDAGYRTRAFSANPNVSPVFDFDRGFEEFHGSYRLRGMEPGVFDWESFIAENRSRGPTRYVTALQEVLFGDVATIPSLWRGLDIKLRDIGVRSEPDDDGAEEALSLIDSIGFEDDEFLFINLMEAHAPYDPPKEYWTVNVDSDSRDWTSYSALLATITGDLPQMVTAERLERAYRDSVRYLSDIYQDIFDSLTNSFDIVITLGDHGELFGEYGTWQHAYGVYPELTHVPLVISGDAVPNKSTDTCISLVDVFHTITELADVDEGDDERSLLTSDDVPGDRSIYTEYHGVNNRNRDRIIQEGYDPEPYDSPLFGVIDETDYGYQTMDGFSAPDDRRDELEALVEAYGSSIETREHNEQNELPTSVQRQLDDLGYV